MELQKRIYHGFDGPQAPPIPRDPQSIRARGTLKKKSVDNEMCALDLLASVADNILLEQQCPTAAPSDGMYHKGSIHGIVKEERQLDDQKLVEFHNPSGQEIGLDVVDIANNEGDFCSGSASAIINSGCTGMTAFDEKEPLNGHVKEKLQSHIGEAPFGFCSDALSSEDPDFLDRNLSKSDKYVYNTDDKVHGDCFTCGFPSPCRDNVNLLASKDDDDNSSECTKRCNFMKTIGDRRIKKLVAPRCSRAPSAKNNGKLSESGVQMHTIYQNWRRGFRCQGSQRIYPLKKRKLLHTNSDDISRFDYEDMCEPLKKATNISASDSETNKFSEATGQSTLFTPRESNVKLRIKSISVPELFIELPQTSTVGSLKKTVMDAIKTLLGDGLRIGVLVQGRKIKNDNSTLLQSGISHDTLGVTLETNPSRINKPVCPEQPSIEVPPQPLSSLTKEKSAGDSKALVEVPESNVQAPSLFAPSPPPPPPPLEKSKRSENAQRRMRRPFSVSEVEALVEAVQELGTGRWRDVKMRAFDNINHRTYVDLKDKWKTLVHTARISPQQRRGEPVPQELLDRVLAAHSYWSHRQATHQSDTCLLV